MLTTMKLPAYRAFVAPPQEAPATAPSVAPFKEPYEAPGGAPCTLPKPDASPVPLRREGPLKFPNHPMENPRPKA